MSRPPVRAAEAIALFTDSDGLIEHLYAPMGFQVEGSLFSLHRQLRAAPPMIYDLTVGKMVSERAKR